MLIAFSAAPAPATTDAWREAAVEVREVVRALAFDPATYFENEDGGIPPMIRIAYTGNDSAWPVYSIAIMEGCLAGETPSPACGSRLTARMVRAPAHPDSTALRERGLHLVEQLVERGAMSRSEVRSHLRPLGVAWLEADLDACPGIRPLLARSAELRWVPEEISNPGPRDEFTYVLHADHVEVVFEQHLRRARYHGYIADDSPAEWATQLAEVLEPCWKPARARPPWRR